MSNIVEYLRKQSIEVWTSGFACAMNLLIVRQLQTNTLIFHKYLNHSDLDDLCMPSLTRMPRHIAFQDFYQPQTKTHIKAYSPRKIGIAINIISEDKQRINIPTYSITPPLPLLLYHYYYRGQILMRPYLKIPLPNTYYLRNHGNNQLVTMATHDHGRWLTCMKSAVFSVCVCVCL